MKFLLLIAMTSLATAGASPSLAKSCPPGLAKKNPPCVPPGQAKKGVVLWAPGDRIGDAPVHWITWPDRYALPPLGPGQRYVVLDRRIYVVDEGTQTVLSVLQVIDALLD
jgi:hypothetical protein